MPITVAMIEEREFKTKVRGYDPVEVDEFLDEICDEMIIMQEEISSLQGRLAQVSRSQAYAPVPAVAPPPAPVAPRDVNAEAAEGAQKIIARAQRVYDDTIADARREAAEIIAKAQAQTADSVVGDLTEQRDALQRQIDDLRIAARSYRDRLLQLMAEQHAALEDSEDLF